MTYSLQMTHQGSEEKTLLTKVHLRQSKLAFPEFFTLEPLLLLATVERLLIGQMLDIGLNQATIFFLILLCLFCS